MERSDLYTLRLIEGVPTTIGTQEVRYRIVRLREICLEDQLAAVEAAERLVRVNGKNVLVLSDEIYAIALSSRHIERFEASGVEPIGRDLIDLKLMGRLHPLDMARIDERIALINLAAQARWGLVPEAKLEAVLAALDADGKPVEAKDARDTAPRSPDPAEAVADAHDAARPGPGMLTDYAAANAAGRT